MVLKLCLYLVFKFQFSSPLMILFKFILLFYLIFFFASIGSAALSIGKIVREELVKILIVDCGPSSRVSLVKADPLQGILRLTTQNPAGSGTADGARR